MDAGEARDIQGMKPVLEECWFLSGEIEHYTREQMREVYRGVRGYQTERCIKLYCSRKFSANQMHEIRSGFEDGLSYEMVRSYANVDIPWQAMKVIRSAFAEENERRAAKYVKLHGFWRRKEPEVDDDVAS